MSIRLRRVQRIRDNPTPTPGYTIVNCLSWYTNNILTIGDQRIPVYQVSPYHLKDSHGCLFENIWQGSKWYPKVFAQTAKTAWDGGWNHPEEVHVATTEVNGQTIEIPTPAYWQWRAKLMQHPQPVRYPNGKQGRHTCKCSLWSFDGVNTVQLDYFTAREQIYARLYAQCVKTTEAFQKLRSLVQAGYKFELLDIDCPESIEVTPTTFQQYLKTSSPAFGHTWTLAMCLLGLI